MLDSTIEATGIVITVCSTLGLALISMAIKYSNDIAVLKSKVATLERNVEQHTAQIGTMERDLLTGLNSIREDLAEMKGYMGKYFKVLT